MIPDSLLSGDNAAYLDQQYQAWLADPESVDRTYGELFDSFDTAEHPHDRSTGAGPSFAPRSIFDPAGGAGGAPSDAAFEQRQAKVVQLINAYRVRAHLDARIDPLERRERVVHPELTLAYYGLSTSDLDAEVGTALVFGLPPRVPLRRLVDHLQAAYAGSIGAEFMNIMDNEQKRFVQERLETLPNIGVLTPDEERRVYRKLCDAENFERTLHTRFPGTKRFSLEGGETLIPLLDLVVERAGARGIKEIVIGMAHRGRLNTLVNIFEKPASLVVREFQDVAGSTQGSGDVKYHLGYSSDLVTVRGDDVHLSLTPNPSHLEAVNSVVQGRVRAKQDRGGDVERRLAMPVLLHGDAAFSGQGSVMELLNLSELRGYAVGGTLHVIVNNQIGFTTPPAEARSTPYATDPARMLAVPIFHVNGEVPRAVAAVVAIAVEYRMRFQRDVVIDMYCYRKHGHNEGDEPSFTQPLMYDVIRSRPTPRTVYGQHLVRIGTLTEGELQTIAEDSFREMQAAAESPVAEQPIAQVDRGALFKDEDPDVDRYFVLDTDEVVKGVRDVATDAMSPLKGLWERYRTGGLADAVDTTVDRVRLVELLGIANTLPDGFTAHAKINRLLGQRLQVVAGERPVDWAVAEQAAFATLLDEGVPVRLAGQDSGRGTFSHRHAVVSDVSNGDELFPLRQVASTRFDVIDSSLSEFGVLGFEVGYSFDTPEGLALWEAQFGDFVNGAQVIIDQFLVSCFQKWNRMCGLVLLLPHGYEGQGPEHSSARLERFLELCAEDNLQVANCSTPANFFHLLRRQVLRNVRTPLVVMTPKSLLRHPECISTLDDLASGTFQTVIGDDIDPAAVRRVVFCSGKVYYELLAARREAGEQRVALVRIEQLYPEPVEAMSAQLARYPDATDVVWCQEEPRNMGAWPRYLHVFVDRWPTSPLPRYVGRPTKASPATGSHKKHVAEQHSVIDGALGFEE